MRTTRILGYLGRKARRAAGVVIVAGGMLFAGQTNAASFFEDFESATGSGPGDAGNLGGGTGGDWGAYGSSFDFSFTGGNHHIVVTDGGDFYGHTIGVAANPQSDPVAIDAGHSLINVEAWLASYTGDGDYTVISIEQFSDAGGSVSLGSPVAVLDGSVTNGDAGWNVDNWSFYTGSTPVLSGAVSYRLQFGGSGNDTYADNIAAESAIPEPGTLVMLGLGSVALVGLARRKK